MTDNPLISVIIPTKNSGETLETCLKSIKAQTYLNFEIIVVDNYSKDSTREIADKCEARIYLKGPERTSQRNFGAKNAKGEYLFHIDSDMELTSRVIEECVEEIQRGFSAIIVPEISVGEGFWTKCKALERSCYIGDDAIEMPRFFDREFFWSGGGYDEGIVIGEHRDLLKRAKRADSRFSRINALIRHHEKRLRLSSLVRKRFYWGKMLVKYYRKHKSLDAVQLTFLRPAYLRNWRRLVRDPIHTIGFLFMNMCESIATGIEFVRTILRERSP